jgi:cation diffusion facilitator CzcD-associated flavoprotein CzcO
VACETFNLSTTREHRAPRPAFWRYATCVARRSGADAHVLKGEVARLEPVSHPVQDTWRVHLADGGSFETAAVVLATGLKPHLRIPLPWRPWWQHLPEKNRVHALELRYANDLAGKRVAVAGSANIATWEAALQAAERGAKVTLLARAHTPTEWQLPFPGGWFTEEGMAAFMALPAHPKRLRVLRKTHIPNTVPAGARRARRGARACASCTTAACSTEHRCGAACSSVQDRQRVTTPSFRPARRGDRRLPAPERAAAHRRRRAQAQAPVVVGGPVRHRPILDDSGRWKNLPPLYPMGAHALMRAGSG